MKTKILVLGSTGMLGHMVLKILSEEDSFEVKGTHITDPADLFYLDAERGLEKLELICRENNGYNYFINCIGIARDKIDEGSSESVSRAVQINSIFPHKLAEFAKRNDTRVIHISTDGVFSGTTERYSEDAVPDCTDIYGRTKSLGEVIGSSNFLNIRSSIIGPSPFEKRGLFEWFQSQPEEGTIRGYRNHFWNGVTTLQFAALCREIIKKRCFDDIMRESHLHHFCPNKPVSKYELLTILKKMLKKKIKITPYGDKKSQIRRVLTTNYSSLRNLFGGNKSIEDAFSELFENLSVASR